MMRLNVAAAATALSLLGASTALALGASSWDEAAQMSQEKDLPVLIKLGTEW